MNMHDDTPAPAPLRHVRKIRRWSVAAVLLAIFGLVGWWLERSHASARATEDLEAHASDAPVQDGELIRFSKAFAARVHLTSESVASKQLEPFVTVSGTLTYDPHLHASVGARIQGRVRRVFKYAGDGVQRGTPLAEIESGELARAQAAVLAAAAKEQVAEVDMKRERALADQKVSSEREAELAHATYAAARAERNAAERALEAFGGSARDTLGLLVLRSPIAGKVLVARASVGKTVDPVDALFEVADLRTLWVELPVFERELGGVRAGDKAQITATGVRDRVIEGTIDHVGAVIDLATRSARVRVVIANPQLELRPGQSVVARVHTTTLGAARLTVPRQALTRVDGKPTLFVLLDQYTVVPRSVVTGPEDSKYVSIASGVSPGERVVVGGMFALKSELFR